MEKSRLMSMVNFVIEQDKINKTGWNNYTNLVNYANFLKQPREIWMFIPCKFVDGVWVVLEEKKPFQDNYHEFVEAKERCLFKGFKFIEEEDGFIYISFKKSRLIYDKEENTFLFDNQKFTEYVKVIEDLIKYNLQLTKAI